MPLSYIPPLTSAIPTVLPQRQFRRSSGSVAWPKIGGQNRGGMPEQMAPPSYQQSTLPDRGDQGGIGNVNTQFTDPNYDGYTAANGYAQPMTVPDPNRQTVQPAPLDSDPTGLAGRMQRLSANRQPRGGGGRVEMDGNRFVKNPLPAAPIPDAIDDRGTVIGNRGSEFLVRPKGDGSGTYLVESMDQTPRDDLPSQEEMDRRRAQYIARTSSNSEWNRRARRRGGVDYVPARRGPVMPGNETMIADANSRTVPSYRDMPGSGAGPDATPDEIREAQKSELADTLYNVYVDSGLDDEMISGKLSEMTIPELEDIKDRKETILDSVSRGVGMSGTIGRVMTGREGQYRRKFLDLIRAELEKRKKANGKSKPDGESKVAKSTGAMTERVPVSPDQAAMLQLEYPIMF